MDLKDYIKIINNSSLIKVKIIPKQPRNEFFAILDDGTFKIRINAVPEKGKANKELINFLSSELKAKKDNIVIFAGVSDQVKLIKINF